MAWFKRKTKGIQTSTEEKKDTPEGLWHKTPTGKIIDTEELEKNFYVSPEDGFHLRIGSQEYFKILFDGKFKEIDKNLKSKDPLKFSDKKTYKQRTKEAKDKSGLKDAIRVAIGKSHGKDVVIACMDFSYIGGSMGSVVGEKISRAIDIAINKKIPLIVRSFKNLDSPGTKVTNEADMQPHIPCYIVKKNQVLVSIASLDFSFIVEENISHIFKLFHKYQLKVNLIQNSAISFSVCVDNNLNHFDEFFNEIKAMYKVSFIKNVDLFTVRHFTQNSLSKIYNLGTSLLSQVNKNTAQIIIQKK